MWVAHLALEVSDKMNIWSVGDAGWSSLAAGLAVLMSLACRNRWATTLAFAAGGLTALVGFEVGYAHALQARWDSDTSIHLIQQLVHEQGHGKLAAISAIMALPLALCLALHLRR